MDAVELFREFGFQVNSPRKTPRKNAWRFLHLHPPPRQVNLNLSRKTRFVSQPFSGTWGPVEVFFFETRFVSRWGKSECLGIWEVLSWCCMTWWWFPCTLDGILLITDSFVLRLQATDPFSTENKPLIYSFWRGRLKFNHVTYGHFVSFDIYSYFDMFHHNATSLPRGQIYQYQKSYNLNF